MKQHVTEFVVMKQHVTEWCTELRCVSCHRRMSLHCQMHSMGTCPACGNNSRSTVVNCYSVPYRLHYKTRLFGFVKFDIRREYKPGDSPAERRAAPPPEDS